MIGSTVAVTVAAALMAGFFELARCPLVGCVWGMAVAVSVVVPVACLRRPLSVAVYLAFLALSMLAELVLLGYQSARALCAPACYFLNMVGCVECEATHEGIICGDNLPSIIVSYFWATCFSLVGNALIVTALTTPFLCWLIGHGRRKRCELSRS